MSRVIFDVTGKKNTGLNDKQRPVDLEVTDWLVVDDLMDSKLLSIDVAILTHLQAHIQQPKGAMVLVR